MNWFKLKDGMIVNLDRATSINPKGIDFDKGYIPITEEDFKNIKKHLVYYHHLRLECDYDK